MRSIETVEEADQVIAHGYVAIRCNIIVDELQEMLGGVPNLPPTTIENIQAAIERLMEARDETRQKQRERLQSK